MKSLLGHSFRAFKTLGDNSVKESAEEVEPLLLLNLAVVVLIELGKELINLGLADVFGKAGTGFGKRDDLRSIDLTVSVDINLIEGFQGGRKRLLSGFGDFLSLFVVELHIFFLILFKLRYL